MHKYWLVLIVILGGFFRFSGLDWDRGYHLQPDERYVSLVLTRLRPTASIGEYFDPERSGLSPYLTEYDSYIYGQLPLTMITYLSSWLGMDDYSQAYLVGRFVSALLDTASVGLVFWLGRRLWNGRVGLIGASFYAFAPLAIQYAHFMVMESWLTFSWLVVILVMAGREKGLTLLKVVVGGVLAGAALAVKLSSVWLLPVMGAMMLAGKSGGSGRSERLVRLGVLGLVAVLSWRFFQPTIFASASWWDWSWQPAFKRAFEFQRAAMAGEAMFPPQWQWVGTARWWFPFRGLVLWGVGPAVGLLAVVGVVWNIWRIRDFVELREFKGLILIWVVGVFAWQGGQFVKTMRYFAPFVPFYCLFAAVTLERLSLVRITLIRVILFGSVVISGAGALMFTGIYRREQTRVAASEWIYENVLPGSTIAVEGWDDPLPLRLPGQDPSQYPSISMSVYDPDDERKQSLIDRWVSEADLVVLSSYRAKGSIGQLPEQFPLMSRFYRELSSGTLGFVKAVEFTSYPSITVYGLRLTVYDDSAEESFWVYDHPKVEVYQKISNDK